MAKKRKSKKRVFKSSLRPFRAGDDLDAYNRAKIAELERHLTLRSQWRARHNNPKACGRWSDMGGAIHFCEVHGSPCKKARKQPKAKKCKVCGGPTDTRGCLEPWEHHNWASPKTRKKQKRAKRARRCSKCKKYIKPRKGPGRPAKYHKVCRPK